jgi:Spy/CpxP family protein refolding chaperone
VPDVLPYNAQMKPLICALAATLLLLQAACAQQPHRHGQPSIDQLASELNLTAAQKTQVQQILNDERAQREQLQSSGEDRRQIMQQTQSDLITKMSAVLTPDQLQQFEQIEQQHHHHGHGFGGYGQSSPGQ